MKKSMKRFLVLFLIIAIITGITRIVYADNNYSCDLEITQDKTTIAPGDTASFQLKASNIQIGNAGMILLQITVEDDSGDITDHFKCTASGDEDNVWSMLANFDGEITFNKQDYDEPVGSESVIGKINLKANADLQEGNYTIKFKGITFNTSDDQQISIPDITKTLEVKTSAGGDSSSGGNSSSGDSSSSGGNSGGSTVSPGASGGSTSSGDSSTPGGNSSSGDSSTPGGNSSSGDSSTPGGSSSSGDSSTPGGSSSSGDSLTPGGSSSSGDSLTPGGSSSSGDSLTPGGSSSSGNSSSSGDSITWGDSSSTTGDSSSGVYNSSSTTKKATDSSNNKSNLPYAGETSNTVKILIIIALVGLSICFFAKYKWLNI